MLFMCILQRFGSHIVVTESRKKYYLVRVRCINPIYLKELTEIEHRCPVTNDPCYNVVM